MPRLRNLLEIFYYDINTINQDFAPNKDHAVYTISRSIPGDDNKCVYPIPVPFEGYIEQGHKFIVSIGSTFLSEKTYSVFNNSIFINSNIEPKFAGRDILFTFIYSSNDIIHFDRTDVIATQNNQAIFTIPEPFA